MARTVTLTYRQVVFLMVLPWFLLTALFVTQQSDIRELRAAVAAEHEARATDTDAYAEILARLNRILGD